VPVTTLYPNATDRTSALPIALREGDEQSGRNIQIRTSIGVSVSGKVVSNLPPVTGQRGQGRPSLVMLVAQGAAAVPDVIGGRTDPLNPGDSSFEFTGVPAGSYEIFARLPVTANTGWGAANPPGLAANPWAFGRTPVEVRGVNVSEISVVVHRGVDVKGTVVVDGKPAPANVRIGLATDESVTRLPDAQSVNTFGQIMTFQPPIGADGSFLIPLVPQRQVPISSRRRRSCSDFNCVSPIIARHGLYCRHSTRRHERL
jgi:hypothetical protein